MVDFFILQRDLSQHPSRDFKLGRVERGAVPVPRSLKIAVYSDMRLGYTNEAMNHHRSPCNNCLFLEGVYIAQEKHLTNLKEAAPEQLPH